MNDPVNGYVYPLGYGQVLSPTERQRVLRNTYWLLALSMVPTVLAGRRAANRSDAARRCGLGGIPGWGFRLHVRH